jgi:hypothetical protein
MKALRGLIHVSAEQERNVQKHQLHDKLLDQEGYYHTHPEEKLLKGK